MYQLLLHFSLLNQDVPIITCTSLFETKKYQLLLHFSLLNQDVPIITCTSLF